VHLCTQDPEYTDKSVVANKEYQYRVTAENEGGESKPSEPSDLIKAKSLRGLTSSCCRFCMTSFQFSLLAESS